MALDDATRARIQAAIAAGRVPTRTGSGRLYLRLGGRGAIPLTIAGDLLTPAGTFYYAESGQEPPQRGLDHQQPLISRGNTDFVMINGRRRAVRHLQADGTARLTRLGQHYFRNRRTEYVVHVPVRIYKAGRPKDRFDFLPVTTLGLARIFADAALTHAQQEADVKRRTLHQLNVEEADANTVLMEISGEIYYYDPNTTWLISRASTVFEDGHAVTEVQLRQPLAFFLLGAQSQLPQPELILEAAFEQRTDKLCVPFQMSLLLKKPLEDVCSLFDNLYGHSRWRAEGVDVEQIKAFCVKFGHPYYFLGSGILEDSFVPSTQQGRAIGFAALHGHAYFYSSCRWISTWRVSDGLPAERLKREPKHQLEDLTAWLPWMGKPAVGTFYCSDLAEARREFLRSGRSPRVTMRCHTSIGSLKYHCCKKLDGCVGLCLVREMPSDAPLYKAWLARLPRKIEYQGERIAGLSQRVFFELLKPERQMASPEEKHAIVESQQHRCVQCGEELDETCEFDHWPALRQLVAGAEQKFQALCSPCHAEKTRNEPRQSRTLKSSFSKRTWDNYAMSPRPPPLVWSPHEDHKEADQLMEIDVRRCRRNALMHCAHGLPIFSALDNITPSIPGTLCDFSYVVERDGRASRLSRLPFVGSMWYHRVAVEFGLHMGLLTWDDIKWSFQATGHVDSDLVAEPLRLMIEAWQDPEMSKMSVNSMIGLWAKDELELFKVRTGGPEDDQGACQTRLFEFAPGEKVIDRIYVTRLLGNSSMRPIHDLIMHTEATRVAQMRFIMVSLGIPQRSIKDVKTDAIILKGSLKLKMEALLEASKITFAELPRLRNRYGEQRQTFLDCRATVAGRPGDDEEVFRLSCSAHRLQGNYKEPFRHAEPPAPLRPWKDVTAYLPGQSLLILGAPGTGKSHFLRELVTKLRGEGFVVDCISKTHASCGNLGMDCVTADHFTHAHIKNGRPRCDVLAIDELTQIDCALWCEIAKLLHLGITFLCCGDFKQFPAICDSWCGTPVPDDTLEHSDLLYELCDGNRITLTENKRSDIELFSFYTRLSAKGLEDALAEGRRIFPLTKRAARYTLVISHRRRRYLNKIANQQEAREHPERFFFKAACESRASDAPQDCMLWPGLQLLGASGKCIKGVFYKVKAATAEGVVVTGAAGDIAVPPEKVCTWLRLAYAVTYAGCQGLTLEGVVRLEDTGSPHFSLKHLYVGSSRATAASLLEVV